MTPPSLNWIWLWLFFDFIVTDFVYFQILLVIVPSVTNRRWVWRFTRLVKTSFAWYWCVNFLPWTSGRLWREKCSLSVFIVHGTSCPFTRREIRMFGTTMSLWAWRWRCWRVPCSLVSSVSSIYSTPASSMTTTAVFAPSIVFNALTSGTGYGSPGWVSLSWSPEDVTAFTDDIEEEATGRLDIWISSAN